MEPFLYSMCLICQNASTSCVVIIIIISGGVICEGVGITSERESVIYLGSEDGMWLVGRNGRDGFSEPGVEALL